MKRCSRCKASKPRSEFGRNKGSPDGLNYWCRACARADSVRRYRKGRPQAKTCPRCKEKLPLSDYGPYEGTVNGLDFLCRDCRALATAEKEKREARAHRPEPRGNGRIRVGRGPCGCGRTSDLWSVDGSPPACLACVQARERDHRGARAAIPAGAAQ